MMQYNILGALEIDHDGHSCTPSAPKVRWVLALLLCRANRIVGVDALTEELWGDNPPRSAVTTTQTYIYQLRRKFFQEGITDRPEDLLETRSPGYILRVRDGQLDAVVFERLVEEGRELLTRGHPGPASEKLRQALAMWRGPALADVPAGRLLEAHVAHLEESRIRTLELRIQADVELGRHRELIPELRMLVAAHPLNEWMHGQLIEALHLAGRRGEALHAFHQLRVVLQDELGLEPSSELQRMQSEVLGSGPVPHPAQRRLASTLRSVALTQHRAEVHG